MTPIHPCSRARRGARATLVVGARRFVRDRHTQRLAEVRLTEYPPIDEGDLGRGYAFARHEVWDDHEAVKQSPYAVVPVEE